MDIYEAIENQFDTVRISLPVESKAGQIFKAALIDDFSFTGSAEWNVGSGAMDVINAGRELATVASQVVSNVSKSGFNTSALNGIARNADRVAVRALTNATYSGSARPQFTVSMTKLCLRASDDITSDVAALYTLVMPATITEIKETAPLGYVPLVTANGRSGVSGTVTLSIGKWFRASGLVCKDVQATFSKQMNKQGRPMFATISVTFMPATSVTAGQMAGYIRKGTASSASV